MLLNIAVISDIHFGAFDAEVLFNELSEEFLDKIEKKKELDLVVITGDYFDCKLNMNSKHAKFAIAFFKRLVSICEKKNAKIRVIQGTISHDNNQIEVLEIEHKDSLCDVKFIYNVSEEEIFKGFKVLYVPEEYMTDRDEYYGEYYKNEYDMIFAHGMVQEVSFCALSQESATTMSKAPIFKTEVLGDMCRLAMFGHIHTPQIIKDVVYYVGSFSRWMFGEEEDKGYYEIKYDTEIKTYDTKFVINRKARRYDTIELLSDSSLFNMKSEEQINFIHSLIKVTDADFIRLKIKVPDTYEHEKLMMSVLNESFNKHKNVKLVFESNNKSKAKKQIEEKVNILLDKYGFIFDKTVDYDIKIARFIQEKYGRNIPVEKIRDYIFGDKSK